jgi:CheY-like chemotaxis protein
MRHLPAGAQFRIIPPPEPVQNQGKDAMRREIAMVVHELRNPLLGIIGHAETLRGSPGEAELKAAPARIAMLGQHMLALVNDLLDLSRLTHEQPKVRHKAVSAPRLFADCMTVVSVQAEAKGLELTLDCAPDFPLEFPGDPTRLRQILVNLLSNAVRFTDKGRIILRAAIEPETGSMCLSVTDQGPGLTPEEIGRLFQPFQQIDGHRKGGTGLGLAICNRLAHAMGGRLRVQSIPGHGATFGLQLSYCARRAEHLALEPSAAAPSGRPDSLATMAPLDCLVVDDNPLLRDIVVKLLLRDGHRAVEAASGHEALDALKTGRFDLVLLDRHLGDLDGFDVARRMRSILKGKPAPRIVGLSASVDPEDVDIALAAGMDAYLSKTLRAPVLIDRIRQLLA